MAAGAHPVPVISAQDLRVQYGNRQVLHGLTFEIVPGETAVVIGGSGSGKSTLLRTLVGLEKPSSGEVRIKGVDIARASARAMDDIRKKIGLAFQGGALIGSLSVGENIALPFAVLSAGTSSCITSQCSATLPSTTRKMSTATIGFGPQPV